MTALTARGAYRLWAEAYEAETAVSHLEALTVAGLGIDTRGRRLLDVGCGTGRRMRYAGSTISIGVDASTEMLGRASRECVLAAGDMRALPIVADSFDVVWCRLAIGHVGELEQVYGELSRVCVAGASVVVSDLSPDAVAAGHRRTFRDRSGRTREVEHYVHTVEEHVRAASSAGLELVARTNGVVGPMIRSFYADAGRLAVYEQQMGLPLVLVLLWRRGS